MRAWLNAFVGFIKSLFDEELTYYASSLSFYTILTFIPLMLIVLSLLPSLSEFESYYNQLKAFIYHSIMPLPSQTLTQYLDTFLQNSSKLGLMGMGILFLTSFLFFQNYEYILSRIFHTTYRSFFRSLLTYLILLLFIPLALIAFFYLYTFIESLSFIASLLSFVTIWLLIFLFYFISPNITIEPPAAIKASFISALIWTLTKTLFIYYAFYNRTYESIYGSFSIVIFFFLWIYLSWIIFLYGLRLCYLLNRESQKEA